MYLSTCCMLSVIYVFLPIFNRCVSGMCLWRICVLAHVSTFITVHCQRQRDSDVMMEYVVNFLNSLLVPFRLRTVLGWRNWWRNLILLTTITVDKRLTDVLHDVSAQLLATLWTKAVTLIRLWERVAWLIILRGWQPRCQLTLTLTSDK